MNYDEVTYWNSRKNPNSPRAVYVQDKHLNYIESHLKGCSYILDFGPGVGRTFPAYKDMVSVSCFDITEQHLEVLKLAASKYDFDFKFLMVDKVKKLNQYSTKEFDAVVASQVLLHQTPLNIEMVMSELARVSNKVIVITWRDNNLEEGANSGEHCFNHDYLKICGKNNWIYSNIKYYKDDMYFVYKEN